MSILTHLQRFAPVEEDEEDERSLSESTDHFQVTPENYSDGTNHANVPPYRRRYTNNSQRPSKGDESKRSNSEVKRRTAFMNNNLKRYIERAHAVNAEMENSIEGISFSKYKYVSKSICELYHFDNEIKLKHMIYCKQSYRIPKSPQTNSPLLSTHCYLRALNYLQ